MKSEGVRKAWEKYKYVILIVLAGAALLLLPEKKSTAAENAACREEATDIAETERQMEQILSHISGVGRLKLMVTTKTDGERLLARDTELSYRGSALEPEDYTRSGEVVLPEGGRGAPIVVKRLSPVYRGALVVCEGGSRAGVKLAVTEAVMALTGLPSDCISVAEWQ